MSQKTVACIIARTNSTRLPKKVLQEIGGKTIIEHIIDKTKKANNLDKIYLCTSVDPNDQVLLEIAQKNNIEGYAGSKDSVIDRMLEVAEIEKADHLVRITGDNIFTDEIFLDQMIKEHVEKNMDYTKTEMLPLGVTAEIMSVSALKRCYEDIDPNKSEYLTVYMFLPEKYKCLILIPPKDFQLPFLNLTVDTLKDFQRTEFIIEKLGRNSSLYLDDIINLYHNDKIPYMEIKPDNQIKLPDAETMSYLDFRRFLDEKTEKSTTILLNSDFYEQHKPNC